MFTRKRTPEVRTDYEVTKTDEEWRQKLSSDRYAVLRRAGTEPAWSGELLHVDGEGVFHCAGCGAELFDTDGKFDSGTGWPSFDRANAKGTIVERTDRSLWMTPHRDPVRPVRWAPRARLPRRPHRHRSPLLRQLLVADL